MQMCSLSCYSYDFTSHGMPKFTLQPWAEQTIKLISCNGSHECSIGEITFEVHCTPPPSPPIQSPNNAMDYNIMSSICTTL